MMNQDKERSERVKNALRDGNLDAVLCALPSNVLMLTGYFPVVGTSVAIFTRDGEICLLAPEDERELAEKSRARDVPTFKPGSLEAAGKLGRLSERRISCELAGWEQTRKIRLSTAIAARTTYRICSSATARFFRPRPQLIRH